MFTGIIQTMGTLLETQPVGGDRRLRFKAPELDLSAVSTGDSIAVNGCCLTAIDIQSDSFAADVSVESLERTTLGMLKSGDGVNLETSLTLSTPLGGHLVSGHVDGVGAVVSRAPAGRSERWVFEVPAGLAHYIAVKGSIAVDGISLTVNEVEGRQFAVNIVPHTAAVTNLGERQPGEPVNIEVDLIARYLERLLDRTEGGAQHNGI